MVSFSAPVKMKQTPVSSVWPPTQIKFICPNLNAKILENGVNIFKVNNKNNRTTSTEQPLFSVSIVDIQQVNPNWVSSRTDSLQKDSWRAFLGMSPWT